MTATEGYPPGTGGRRKNLENFFQKWSVKTAETIEKLNSLDKNQFMTVTDLINRFYIQNESRENVNENVNIFRKTREEMKDYWMTDEEIDNLIEEYRAERRANRH